MAMRRPDPSLLRKDDTMPQPAVPLPYPDTDTTWPLSSPDGTVPPMPSEVTKERTHTQGPAAAGRFRAVMMPLRKMMRSTPSPP